jgi:hypothetical protein
MLDFSAESTIDLVRCDYVKNPEGRAPNLHSELSGDNAVANCDDNAEQRAAEEQVDDGHVSDLMDIDTMSSFDKITQERKLIDDGMASQTKVLTDSINTDNLDSQITGDDRAMMDSAENSTPTGEHSNELNENKVTDLNNDEEKATSDILVDGSADDISEKVEDDTVSGTPLDQSENVQEKLKMCGSNMADIQLSPLRVKRAYKKRVPSDVLALREAGIAYPDIDFSDTRRVLRKRPVARSPGADCKRRWCVEKL